VSFFAMGDVKGQQEGLRWPIAGLDFRPGSGRLGVSNAVGEGPIRLKFTAPGMLVLLPLSCLAATIRALAPGLPAAP
jgi:thiamine pyrophosphokinase